MIRPTPSLVARVVRRVAHPAPLFVALALLLVVAVSWGPAGTVHAENVPAEAAPVETPDDPPGRAGDAARDEEDAARDEEREATDDDEQEPSDDAARVTVEEGRLSAREGGEVLWVLPVPAAGGPTSTLLATDDAVFLGHGIYLLEVDRRTGSVVRRSPLPAPAAEVVETDGELVTVLVSYETGSVERVQVPPETPVTFGSDPAWFRWLRAGSDEVDDPAATWRRDPTNPWLALAAAEEAEGADRDELLDGAVAAASELPFFESAGLARELARAGEHDRAERAMDEALRDFAERGYDPRLATDLELRDAYGFPLPVIREALDRNDPDAAAFWAPYAWRLAAEEVPETIRALEDVASALREQGRVDAADLWRGRAADLRRAGLATWLDRAALALGRFGWYGVAALLGAFALSWITVLAKVWRAQSLARAQRRERAEPTRPWTRLWVARQASTTEKVALIVVLVLVALQAGLAGWADRGEAEARVLGSGTLASPSAQEALSRLPDTPQAHFARGVSAHVRGLADEARASYQAAGEYAPALTNLGVATGDDSRFQAALRVDPREPVARYHLGRAGNPSPFHEAYGGSEPLMAVPGPLDFSLGAAGDWRAALGDVAAQPWRALREARPADVPLVAWWAILIAYATLLAALIVQLFVPRPRVARHAPRTPVYHPLALAVPGSGHLDELWGLLLVVPWSIVGLDALRQLLGAEPGLGLSLATEAWLLAVLWVANLVGFTVEAASYRRRMRLLREEKPELASSYGLRPRPVKTET